ncbi:MAG: 50S ribosomal protein L29 [Verrucomicrobia bacterium GWC2_42_7]|nr:MAG: 50S ribosomal protein L29 [Verrucomicrobia bacterium GWC2_42_7]
MKSSEIREMTVVEITKKLEEERVSLFNLSIRKNSTRVGKPHEFKAIRRGIARMETILKQKEVKA